LASRPRRNRRSDTFRAAIRETSVGPQNFILPIFVHDESDKNIPIASMPDYYRLGYGKNVLDFVGEARSYGVNQVVIFPKVSTMFALETVCGLVCCI
jgi:porphobilinogen synthase